MKNSTLNWFDWFLIIGITVTSLISNVDGIDVLGTTAGISGVVCVVLVAKRSIWNYPFGIINVLLYGYISYKAKVYGDAVLNLLYYFPMNIIGWIMWQSRRERDIESNETNSKVAARFMTHWGRTVMFSASIVATLLCGYLLSHFTADPQPYKDSFTTVFSIVAMFLMVKAFMEQWILWVLVDFVSVIMWAWLWYKGQPHADLVFLMWVFYFANAVNGLVVWTRSAKLKN